MNQFTAFPKHGKVISIIILLAMVWIVETINAKPNSKTYWDSIKVYHINDTMPAWRDQSDG